MLPPSLVSNRVCLVPSKNPNYVLAGLVSDTLRLSFGQFPWRITENDEKELPRLGSSGTKAISRRTTPGSMGRNTLSHSDNCSSAFASFTGPTMEESESDTAADWYRSCLRFRDKEEDEDDDGGEAEALGMRR